MKKIILTLTLLLSLTAPATAQTASTWAGASWVWDKSDADKIAQNNEPRYLRRTFDLAAKPSAAELWITVDNLYIAYVNGQKVGADAEWSTVEKYDVAKHLIVGKNVLAIQATNQGGVAGAIARLHIKTADKKDLFVVTDEKTKIMSKPPPRGAVWLDADFDDSTWFAAISLGDPSIGPWNVGGGPTAGKGKKGGGQFGYDTTEVTPVKGRLSAEEQKKLFIVPKDFEIELVAADPVIINPITMVMDERGRIIVSESHTYRYGPPGSPIKPFANPVVRLDPDGKGGFNRTLIADGFADPVMGIAVKGDKLWLTANNYLYTYDIAPAPPEKGKGIAINKKTIVTDLNKAWNPFGMFVLEWGPDGKLYMSVGNHAINLQSSDGKMSGRGSSGIIVRMEPDGSKMERLVHGLRVPYSFEYDPFGQLWLLSNGEGNPNRFVRVIEGVDYHCYSRGAVDNNWLAGNHPLAPPSEEIHRGADTQLMRYYAAAYPQEYQGNLFLCNWGAHGFAGNNRAIIRFVPDERNNIVKREPLVYCTDPHFRPAHIILDQDGSLLIADWYGRDDESDMTGRIWRLKYVGKNAPVVKHKLDSEEWKNDDYAISALGSPSHLVREKAVETLLKRSGNLMDKLKTHAATAKEPLGAASALWLLRRRSGEERLQPSYGAVNHPDWRVRRLRLSFSRPQIEKAGWDSFSLIGQLSEIYAKETDAAVLCELALLNHGIFRHHGGRPEGIVQALRKGAALDPHLRYEAAWHLARTVNEKTLTTLLTDVDANLRLAGLIAIDVACYENFNSKKAALAVLAKALENPGKLDHQLLLEVARLDGDASIVPALEKLIARDDVPTATVAKAFLILKAKAGPGYALKAQGAGKRFIEAVEKGQLKIASPADQLVIFEFLESEGPTPFALKQIDGQLRSSNPSLKQAAHVLARRFGPKADSLAPQLWPSVLDPKTKFDDTIEYLSTIARVEKAPNEAWIKMLAHDDPYVRAETVRWWRSFKDKFVLVGILRSKAPGLIKKDEKLKEDLAAVFRDLGEPPATLKELQLPEQERDKDALTKHAMKELAAMPAADKAKRAAMGLQVFERNACTKCHTTATQTTRLAPSLKGIAGQKLDYLIESVLHPSKIIKTGFDVEVIETKDGKVITGLVKDDGKSLRVIQAMAWADGELRIDKANIESRRISKISIMPDGQEALLSRREFVDLIAYMQTLK